MAEPRIAIATLIAGVGAVAAPLARPRALRKGVAVSLPASLAGELIECPDTPAELDALLAAVRLWMTEVELGEVTVESRWRLQCQPARRDADPLSRLLMWKYEDGLDSVADGEVSVDDVGPDWLLTDGPYGEVVKKLADGEWISRSEARRLAHEHGYQLREDG
jgi:hypothetical protein